LLALLLFSEPSGSLRRLAESIKLVGDTVSLGHLDGPVDGHRAVG